MLLEKPLAFVDIETTGTRLSFDRIIEIGILRVENNRIVNTFQSLINPACHLPPEITSLTNITQQELEKAPLFSEIKDTILDVLDDCIFIAHNVRFDYGFLKNEFRRVSNPFSPKHFCTVKLSRFLYPQYAHHNLDSIIERFGFSCASRHRALDDAAVVWEFFKSLESQFPQDILKKALDKALKKPFLPIKLSETDFETLPESPGVYIFYGANHIPLYIGKSINIKERVTSHFANDHASPIEMKISQQIENIEAITTSGELGALLKESKLIKSLQPLYNRKLRIQKKLTILKRITNKNGFETVTAQTVDQIQSNEIDTVMGVFPSQKKAEDFLFQLAKEFFLCEKILNLEKTKTECFGFRLGRCKGACIGKEAPLRYNTRFLMAFFNHKIKPWPFKGTIAIEERNTLLETTETFLFDKWCYFGMIYSEGSIENKNSDVQFDYDTYKILKSYLKSKKNLKNIKLVSPRIFQSIMSAQ